MARRASQTSHASGLEQPQVRPIPGALDWIANHQDEYVGQWVAVGAEGLVASGATYKELRSKLESLDSVLISHVV